MPSCAALQMNIYSSIYAPFFITFNRAACVLDVAAITARTQYTLACNIKFEWWAASNEGEKKKNQSSKQQTQLENINNIINIVLLLCTESLLEKSLRCW